MNKIQQLRDLIEQPQRVVILTHHHADGDTIGSSLALARVCQKEGHQVTVITPDAYPRFLNWMPGINTMLIAEKEDEKKIAQILQAADVIFFMDFIPLHRLGKFEPLIEGTKAFKVAIDHHPDEKDGGYLQLLFCDLEAAATCSLLYELLVAIGKEHHIDAEVATSLYVGILTDTGCFAHSNTSPKVHRTAAILIEKGVNANAVYHAVYGNQSIERMRFIANAIAHRLVFMPDFNAAYFAIPRKDFLKFHLQPGDKAGIVSYALNLEGVVMAAMIVEQKSPTGTEVSISFRSVGDIPVNQIADAYFGGGGHKNAAGAISSLPLDEVVERFEAMIHREMPKRKPKPSTSS